MFRYFRSCTFTGDYVVRMKIFTRANGDELQTAQYAGSVPTRSKNVRSSGLEIRWSSVTETKGLYPVSFSCGRCYTYDETPVDIMLNPLGTNPMNIVRLWSPP